MINKVVHLYYLLLLASQFNIFLWYLLKKNNSHWRKRFQPLKTNILPPTKSSFFDSPQISSHFPPLLIPSPPSLSLHRIRKACLSNPNVAIRVLFLDLLTVFAVETWRFLLLLTARGFALRRLFQSFSLFWIKFSFNNYSSLYKLVYWKIIEYVLIQSCN